ncbi:unnamed protein product [Nezara viridula]|uniref:Neuropeptide n=1 Tax=Nezara viridula TaxID=85310 RepID=A0A9P0MLT7_NEZVI|nr:unnamed protein product [Nezara viridula]
MKVFHVTLLIVGLVASASSSSKNVVDNLKDTLEEDIRGIRTRSKELIQLVYKHLQDDVPAFMKNPLTDSTTLINHVTDDANAVIVSATSDIRTMKYHVEVAINELKPMDIVLEEILNKLLQQLDDEGRDAAVKKDQLLKQASSHAFADAWLVYNKGADAARETVLGHVNEDFNFYVTNVRNFIDQVEKYVSVAMIKLQQVVS